MHRWFLRLARSGVFEGMAHVLAMADRERAGREASPTTAVVDAQAARAGSVGMAGARGYDAARRVAAVSPANLHDSHGGITLLQASRQPWPFVARCCADRAYAGPRVRRPPPSRSAS